MNTHALTLSVCTLGILVGCGGGGGSGSRSTAAPATTAVATSQVTLTALAPDQGTAQGDVEVTVTGSGFGPGAVVEFDGAPAAAVTIVSSDTLLCRTPAHAEGVVDVQVVLPSGDVALFANAFTYTRAAIRRTGVLDPTFGGTGVVTQDSGNMSFDEGYGVTVDGQGRIIVVGTTNDATSDRDVAVWRYLPDGTPDATFGTNGLVTVDASAAGGAGWDQGNAVVVDARGRIVVAGYSRSPANNADMTVWRFLDSGARDLGFAGSGFFTHHNAGGGDNWDVGRDVAIDATGRIVVAGYSNTPGGSADMAVWRLTDAGALDPTFGAGQGYVTHDSAAGGAARDEGNTVAIDAQGRIVVAGYSRSATSTDMALWRFTPVGALDPTFAGRGFVSHDAAGGTVDGYEVARGLAIDTQGRIVIVGTARGPANNDLALWRYAADGTLDPTFGAGGIVTRDNAAGGAGSESGYQVAVDAAGSIVAVGTSVSATDGLDIAVWQLTDTGANDLGFGPAGAGVVTHANAAGGNSSDIARAVTIDAQGKIVVAGSSRAGTSNTDVTVWRFE